MQGDQARVVQGREQKRLRVLPAVVVVVGGCGIENLDRDVASKVPVHCAVDGGGSADSDQLGGLVPLVQEHIHGCPPGRSKSLMASG